jgi:hypothetical protein
MIFKSCIEPTGRRIINEPFIFAKGMINTESPTALTRNRLTITALPTVLAGRYILEESFNADVRLYL